MKVRLKELLAKQAQLNSCLDLDKHGAQIVDESGEEEAASAGPRRPPRTAQARALAAKPAVIL
jgi:hypothetical protein